MLIYQGRRERGAGGCQTIPSPPSPGPFPAGKIVFPFKTGKHKIFNCEEHVRLYLLTKIEKTKST